MKDFVKLHFFIALITSACLILSYGLIFYLTFIWPNVAMGLSLAALFSMFAIPIYFIERLGMKLKDFNIYAHNLDSLLDFIIPPFKKENLRIKFTDLKKECLHLLHVSVIIFPLYIFGYYLSCEVMAYMTDVPVRFTFKIPESIIKLTLLQLISVALPEEFFFRGYVQSSLLKKWPNRVHILGFPLGRSIIVTNLLFAFGHFVQGFNPERLLTFFPGLIFSYLVFKNKSLFSAIIFHASCNILSHVLFLSITFG